MPFPDGGGITDLWHTGWRLASADQGGDLHGPWELETGEAIVWRLVEFPAGPSKEPGFVHTTASIDLDVVLDGELDLALPGSPTTRLATGDLVVQRGTAHAWTNPGTAPARLLAIMIGVPASRPTAEDCRPASGGPQISWLGHFGAIAQLAERRLCKADVWGSNPHGSTRSRRLATVRAIPNVGVHERWRCGAAIERRQRRGSGWLVNAGVEVLHAARAPEFESSALVA